MKEHIKMAFDESYQRFGANRIVAVLSARGIYASPKYVRELMQEMGCKVLPNIPSEIIKKRCVWSKSRMSFNESSKRTNRIGSGSAM